MSLKATRAYGEALLALGRSNNRIVALDADLSQSTYSAGFAKASPIVFNVG